MVKAAAARASRLYTVEEYFELEAHSEVRHEFMDGKIIEMPGELLPNIKITTNCVMQLNQSFQANDSNCFAYPFNAKTAVNKKMRYRYPDVVVTCENEPDDRYVQFPSLLVEVLSPGTETVDKTDKLAEYKSIPTVQYYMIVASKEVHVTLYARNNQNWTPVKFESLTDIVNLPALNCQISLKSLYKGIDFNTKTA